MSDDRPADMFQLDESTCLLLLGVQHVGRLIVPGEDPYVIPVNYRVVGRTVVFRTERRPIIDAIVDRHVVFEVDMFDERTRSGWSVVVRGPARDVSGEAGHDPGEATGDAREPWAPGERDQVVGIATERLTGRLLRGAVAASQPLDGRGYL